MNTENTVPIKLFQLSIKHLQSHPIWSWYEGPLDEDEDTIAPVPLTEEAISSKSTLLVYARVTLSSDEYFDGNITYDIGTDEVYAIHFWVGGVKYGFNSRLKDLAEQDTARLRKQLGRPDLLVFPIRYSLLTDTIDVPDGVFDFQE